MTEPAGRTVLVVNGRVYEVPPRRSADLVRLEGSVIWWEALALLGGSLLILGGFLGADLGFAAALVGVALFFVTAVFAADERYEFATALGIAAVIWTSAGIAVDLGTDPSLIGSFLAFGIVGATMLIAGVLGSRSLAPSKHLNAVRRRMRRASP
ncbi:MAG: hypothetical protein WB786_08050 [Thermoplasmata archaeon]